MKKLLFLVPLALLALTPNCRAQGQPGGGKQPVIVIVEGCPNDDCGPMPPDCGPGSGGCNCDPNSNPDCPPPAGTQAGWASVNKDIDRAKIMLALHLLKGN